MHRTVLLAVALAAYSTANAAPDDQCKQVADKARSVLHEMSKSMGHEMTDTEIDAGTAQCRQRVAAGKGLDPLFTCFLAARDKPAMSACYRKSVDDYLDAQAEITATHFLHELGSQARHDYSARGRYVAGKVGPTPAKSCCAQPDHECGASDEWQRSPIWSALRFAPTEGRFQYTYESTDPKSFTATAISDPGCQGHPVTLTIHGSIDQDIPQVSQPSRRIAR